MGNFDTSWHNMKKFLGSRTVKEEIMNFDAQKIKKELCDDVQKLLARKSGSFDHATIYHVSVAAAPLAGIDMFMRLPVHCRGISSVTDP